MKKQSNLSRLLQIAGNHKYLTYASWVLSAISALIALVPFYYIWKVMQEVLAVAPDFSHAQNLTRNGWMAVLFAVIAAQRGVPHCHQPAPTNDGAYCKAAAGVCRAIRQRQAAQDRQ